MATPARALTLKKALPAHEIELKVLKNAKKAIISEKIARTKALQRETSTALLFHRYSWKLPADDGPWGEVRRKIRKAWSPSGNIKTLSARELVALAAGEAQKHGDSIRVWHDIALQLSHVKPFLGAEQVVSLGISFCRAQKDIPVAISASLLTMIRTQDISKLSERSRAQAIYVLAKAGIRDVYVYETIANTLLKADLADISLVCYAFQAADVTPPHAFLMHAEETVRRALRRSRPRETKSLFKLTRFDDEPVDPKHLARVCAAFDAGGYNAPDSWWGSCAEAMKGGSTEALATFALASGRANRQVKYIAHEVWNRIARCTSVTVLVKLAEALCAGEWHHRVIHRRLQQRLFRICSSDPDTAVDFLLLPMIIDSALASRVLDAAFQYQWTDARRVKISQLLCVGFRPSPCVDIYNAYTTDVGAMSHTDFMNYARAWMRIDAAKGQELLDCRGHVDNLLLDGNLTHAERACIGVFARMEQGTDVDLSQLDITKLSATEIVHFLCLLVRRDQTVDALRDILWRRCSDKFLMQACPAAVDRLCATVWDCSSWDRNDNLVASLPTRCRLESMYAFLPRLDLQIPADAQVSHFQKPLWRRLCFDTGVALAASSRRERVRENSRTKI